MRHLKIVFSGLEKKEMKRGQQRFNPDINQDVVGSERRV
jgi:hypothetical protein